MLNYLHIENIAVIEKSDIYFTDGFNVFTGETGAGKSIIIDSINAVLGARTSKDLIRKGCNSACVSAEFSNVGDAALNELKQYGFSADENGNVIITRNMSADGRTVFRVNSAPATASTVKEIGKYLINIHGQHDNQSLLNPDKYCGFIDKIAENNDVLTAYSDEFKKFISIRKELKELQMDEDEKFRKIDLLKYQINELETANIQVGEYSTLREKLKLARDFEKTQRLLNNANTQLKGSENIGITEMLSNIYKDLSGIETSKIKQIAEKLGSVYEDLCDASAELDNYVNYEFSEQINPDEIGDRLDLIGSLMKKYGNTEEATLQFLDNAKNELDKITISEKRINELEILLEKSETELIKKAKILTETRKNACEKFSKDVTETLKYLDMPNVIFYATTEQTKYSKNGCDTVSFMISANIGEDAKPLYKVASGGELSRVMLAIKSILADKDDVETLIFDEIDSGISGRAALKVAEQLKKVSNNKQVICVTHLAQITAAAKTHLYIEKNNNENKTFTTVLSLDYNRRIEELARIMSGTEITENLFNSAKELLDRSL